MIVNLPWTAPPITANQQRRMHFHAEAKCKSGAMLAARYAIRNAKLTPVEKAVVVLHWRQPDNRRRDGDGADVTKKVVLDALVKEGVLRDDSWRYVIHSGVTCHPPIPGQPGAMWLSITSVEEFDA